MVVYQLTLIRLLPHTRSPVDVHGGANAVHNLLAAAAAADHDHVGRLAAFADADWHAFVVLVEAAAPRRADVEQAAGGPARSHRAPDARQSPARLQMTGNSPLRESTPRSVIGSLFRDAFSVEAREAASWHFSGVGTRRHPERARMRVTMCWLALRSASVTGSSPGLYRTSEEPT